MQITSHPTSGGVPAAAGPGPSGAWQRRGLLVAAGLLAASIAVVGVVQRGGDTPRPSVPAALSLTMPGGDSMQSCMLFDVAILRDMPVALAGTVTALDAQRATLTVDHWYKGGSAALVTVDLPDPNTSAALDGPTFTRGQRYLLTATNGTVNGCGFSGPATSELQTAYAQAFGD